jgi:hypothetical protein
MLAIPTEYNARCGETSVRAGAHVSYVCKVGAGDIKGHCFPLPRRPAV